MDLKRSHSNFIQSELLAHLLYVRGVNRIAWSNKLLEGIPWKNYVVFPPQDIASMLTVAIEDFEHLLELEKLPTTFRYMPAFMATFLERIFSIESLSNDDYFKLMLPRFLRHKETSISYRVNRLIYNHKDIRELVKYYSDRNYYSVYLTLKYYYSRSGQRILKRATTLHTLDDILQPRNKVVFDFFLTFVNQLHIR